MKTYAIAVIAALALGAAACTGQEAERPVEARSLGAATQAASPAPPAAEQEELPPTPLAAEVATRDLGTVGITDGLVETTFRVSNSGDEPVQLAAV